jgi:hypothetical protein
VLRQACWLAHFSPLVAPPLPYQLVLGRWLLAQARQVLRLLKPLGRSSRRELLLLEQPAHWAGLPGRRPLAVAWAQGRSGA